ncbi:MAG: proline racemase family protein [Ectothiorhodospiraceae bacterium]|nr:proline racemase family protein [Chromatiales bacterium]MCP5153801.1 proline racemase family protein [Ectothiorhodospiraceae bacterium]
MRWRRTVTVVGAHAEGEVGDVITGGVGDVPGSTVWEKARWLEREGDWLRRVLINEPRGSVARHVNLVVPACDPRAAMGYVIMEPEEYVPMSGSNTICVATVLLETGMVPMREPVTELVLEAPGGLIALECACRDGKVREVRFTNVPAFALHLARPIEVPGVGTVTVDVAYGGMLFVLFDAAPLGFRITPDEARDICELGERVKAATNAQLECVHPENPEIRGVSIAEVRGPLRRRGDRVSARNTVIVSPGRLDRSPCGTGTSARLAVMHARREIAKGEVFEHRSIIGTRFRGRIERTTRVAGRPAVVTSIAGQAWITGIHQYGIDPTDPFPEGYRIADTWGVPGPR